MHTRVSLQRVCWINIPYPGRRFPSEGLTARRHQGAAEKGKPICAIRPQTQDFPGGHCRHVGLAGVTVGGRQYFDPPRRIGRRMTDGRLDALNCFYWFATIDKDVGRQRVCVSALWPDSDSFLSNRFGFIVMAAQQLDVGEYDVRLAAAESRIAITRRWLPSSSTPINRL